MPVFLGVARGVKYRDSSSELSQDKDRGVFGKVVDETCISARSREI